MAKVAVVYHSGYGHTAKQAQADLEAARLLGQRVAEAAARWARGQA